MKIAINTRFKKILIVCLGVLVVAGSVGAYFIFRNTDKTIDADKTITASQTTNTNKTVNTDKTNVRKAQFVILPSKRLTFGEAVRSQSPFVEFSQSVQIDTKDKKAMDNDTFYYLNLNNSSRFLTFKTFANQEDYKHYKCIAIEIIYPEEKVLKHGGKSKIITDIHRIDFEYEKPKGPLLNENGLIENYYCSAIAWADSDKKATASSMAQKELNYGKLTYNCILTTLDDKGNPEGYIDDYSKLHGKYYSTYKDIVKARAWKKPENFKKYFNNEIVFPHLEDFQRDSAEFKSSTSSKSKNIEDKK